MQANMADTETGRETAVMQSASQAGRLLQRDERDAELDMQTVQPPHVELSSLAAKAGLCEMEQGRVN